MENLSRVPWFIQLGDADAARFVCALESVRHLDWLHIKRGPDRRLVVRFGAEPVIALELGEPGEDIPSAMRAVNLDLSRAIYQRLQAGKTFRACVLREAVRAMLDDNLNLTKGLLRRVIDATVGYDDLAVRMEAHPKSLVRMLSPVGNPTARHLIGILTHLTRIDGVAFVVQLDKARQR